MIRKSSLFLFVILLTSLNYAGSDIVGETPAVNAVSGTFITTSFNMVEFDSGNTAGLYDSILYNFDLNVTQARELNVDISFYDAMGYYLNSYYMSLGNETVGTATYSANIPADFLYQLYYNGSMRIDFFIREFDSANYTSTTIGTVSRTLFFNYQNYERPNIYIDYSTVTIIPYDDDLGVYNTTVAGSADGIIVQVYVTQSLPGSVSLNAYFDDNQTYSYYSSIGDSGDVYQSVSGTYLHELFIPENGMSKLNGTVSGNMMISGDFSDNYGNFTYLPTGPSIPFQMNSSFFENNFVDVSLQNVFEIDSTSNGLTNEIVVTVALNTTNTRLYFLNFYGYLGMNYIEGDLQYYSNNSIVVGPSMIYVNVTFSTHGLYNQSIYSNIFDLYLEYSYEMIHYTFGISEYTYVSQFNITNLNFDVPPVWISSIELIGMYNPVLGLDAGFDYMEVRFNFSSTVSSWLEFSTGILDSMYWYLYGFVVNEWVSPGNHSLSYFIDGSTVYGFNQSGSVKLDVWTYYDYNSNNISQGQFFNNYIDSSSYNPSGQYIPGTGPTNSTSPTSPPTNTTSPTSPPSNTTFPTTPTNTTSSTTPTSTLGNSTSSVTNSSGALGNTTNNAPPTPELPLPAPSFWLTISSFAIMMVVLRRRRLMG